MSAPMSEEAQRYLQKWAVEARTGLVVFLNDEPIGWISKLGDANRFAPGVRALGVETGIWCVACGGTPAAGAERWEVDAMEVAG
jgi:hypothetical protein